MADYTITFAEVQALVPSATEALTTQFIAMLSGVDACLEGQAVPDELGKSLKRLAVAHLSVLTLNGGRGVVTSETVPAGSRSFAAWKGGTKGLSMTPFGSILLSLDGSLCVTGFFDLDGPHLFIGTAGT